MACAPFCPAVYQERTNGTVTVSMGSVMVVECLKSDRSRPVNGTVPGTVPFVPLALKLAGSSGQPVER